MKSLTFIVVALVLFMAFRPPLYGAERAMDTQDPMTVIQSYLRATYARDFAAAYRFISAEDRKVRDVNRYVQQRGPYSGFILDAARKLSEFIEVGDIERARIAARCPQWRSSIACPTRKKSRRCC